MAVQLQWGLETTGQSGITFARSLVEAATTDDVQQLAILACEQFGNTLAISQEALEKVDRLVLPPPEHKLVKFAKSTIGYAANDCASALGRCLAGQQFLALATALITTMGVETSGRAIYEMLIDTAKDKTLLPTLRQVCKLLESIEPRCHRAGLTADVYGCQSMLPSASPQRERFLQEGDLYHPGSEGVKILVDTLRQLHRVGDASITHVSISTTSYAPWIVSFVHWCTGYRPRVVMHDGSPILEKQDSNITVVVSDSEPGLRITVHSSISEPKDLVDESSPGKVKGMVSMREYGDIMLQHSGFDSDAGLNAFHEAMPDAMQQVAQKFQLHKLPPSQRRGCFPYPEDRVLRKVYTHLFGREPRCHVASAPTPLTKLPLMARFLQGLQEGCTCVVCTGYGPNGLSGRHVPRDCKVTGAILRYLENLAQILSLSLFEEPEFLQASTTALTEYSHARETLLRPFAKILGLEIEAFQNASLDTRSLELQRFLGFTLALIGHGTLASNTTEFCDATWVISSFKGQAVWLTIFESFKLVERGSLSLSWSPGVLRHRGSVYQRVLPRNFSGARGDVAQLLNVDMSPLLKPRNYFHSLRSQWDVSADSAVLRVVLNVHSDSDVSAKASISPWIAVLRLMDTFLFMEKCAHDPNSALPSSDATRLIAAPMRPHIPINSATNSATKRLPYIVPVAGNEMLRFVALACTVHSNCVLRGSACMACCLERCRELDADVLIL